MRKLLAIVLTLLLLSAPATAGAQQTPEKTLHPAGPLLAAALDETRKLGRALDTAAAVGGAQIALDSNIWYEVQNLPSGSTLRLTLSDGTELEGQLVEVHPEAVVLRNNRVLKGQLTTAGTTTLRDAQNFQRSSLSVISIVSRNDPLSPWAKEAIVMGVGLVGALIGIAVMLSGH